MVVLGPDLGQLEQRLKVAFRGRLGGECLVETDPQIPGHQRLQVGGFVGLDLASGRASHGLLRSGFGQRQIPQHPRGVGGRPGRKQRPTEAGRRDRDATDLGHDTLGLDRLGLDTSGPCGCVRDTEERGMKVRGLVCLLPAATGGEQQADDGNGPPRPLEETGSLPCHENP